MENTILTRSGRWIDFNNPHPDQFTFSDIAGGLSKICRFGGQCNVFYSVAEHLVRCAWQAFDDNHSVDVQVACLFHDAHEGLGLNDIVKPLKVLLSNYGDFESKMEQAVSEKFIIDFKKYKPIIKEIDIAMLLAERNALFSVNQHKLWTGEETTRKLNVSFNCWTPHEAEYEFTYIAQFLGIDVTK